MSWDPSTPDSPLAHVRAGRPLVPFTSRRSLEAILDRAVAESEAGRPPVVALVAGVRGITVGLGPARGFVQVQALEGPDELCWVTAGDEADGGRSLFWRLGVEPVEVPNRCLVGSADVREAAWQAVRGAPGHGPVPWERPRWALTDWYGAAESPHVYPQTPIASEGQLRRALDGYARREGRLLRLASAGGEAVHLGLGGPFGVVWVPGSFIAVSAVEQARGAVCFVGDWQPSYFAPRHLLPAGEVIEVAAHLYRTGERPAWVGWEGGG